MADHVCYDKLEYMAHIHDKPGQYDVTSSAFIVRLDTDQPRLLLHLHKKMGKLFQPGGHVELHETPWEAICHEIIEETGYDIGQLEILQPKGFFIKKLAHSTVHPVSFCHSSHGFEIWPDHFHTDSAYAFVADGGPKNKPTDGESTDLRWFTVDELKAIDSSIILEDIRTMGIDVLTTILKEWEPTPLP